MPELNAGVFLNWDVFNETCGTNKQTKVQQIGLNLKNAHLPCFQQFKPGKSKAGFSEALLHLCWVFLANAISEVEPRVFLTGAICKLTAIYY